MSEVGLPSASLLAAALAVLEPRFNPSSGLLGHVLEAVALFLIPATVLVVVHHAEAVAHRVGEPFGTLVLTLAVTAIEASVIVSMMLDHTGNPTLARESIFSTVMVVCAGVIGICLTLGGWRHVHQDIKRQGTSAFLSMLIALAGFILVLPNFTVGGGSGGLAPIQLAFIATLAFLLYISFLVAQARRHRDDFISDGAAAAHPAPPERSLIYSVVLLLAGLIGVVVLTERVAIAIEERLIDMQIGQADAIIGALVATIVLMPESIAAIKAAMRNELQRSLNIALGSACATIGLTVPVVSAVNLFVGGELILGLVPRDMVLLTIALATCVVSFTTGRTTVLTDLVHLVVFLAYLLLIAVP
ncbi:calcium:proton antiporter [Shinella sp. BYT-45]|uniref:calcium:proton antiporter n=1 Tax=Shinella sp. BYT-45 TaxID=3377377 RepID=UPI003980895A